jgi:lysine-ketoglutarate reductase/saccharopine dehydrogenase-like protein (TIGR00300 family)
LPHGAHCEITPLKRIRQCRWKRLRNMTFEMPRYRRPEFQSEPYRSYPDAALAPVSRAGVAPEGFHATTIYPEYIKIDGEWVLLEESRMDSVVVVNAGRPEVKEFRRLEPGERVVLGRTEDGSEGVMVHSGGFEALDGPGEPFVFRTGRTRETSYSMDYDRLYDLLEYERMNGYVVWVLGPAVVFDFDSREAMVGLIDSGFVHAILAGNALAAHDMEASVFRTALGQDIYSQELAPNGHYNHLEVINRARDAGSVEALIESGQVSDGIVHACVKKKVPLVIAGSIRDDGPVPSAVGDAYSAQDAMRRHARKATTVIGLATQLHSIATGNMTPCYQVADGEVRPVFIYIVDVSEFAVNKLRDRGTLEVISIVTNVQDFLVNLGRKLL